MDGARIGRIAGRSVTASVVKSIFMVIVVDGLFAMFFAAVRQLSAGVSSPPAIETVRRGRARDVVIRVRGLKVGFGDQLVMDGLDLDLYRGEVLGFVGASGAGKSVLTRTILGLIPKRAGTIEVYGHDIDAMTHAERDRIGRALGRAVPAGRAVLQSHRQAEHPGADARASGHFAAAAATNWPCSRSRSSACRRTPRTNTPPSSRAA